MSIAQNSVIFRAKLCGGYRMSKEEQAAVYLRVREEYTNLKAESLALKAVIIDFGERVAASGQALAKNPLGWNADAEIWANEFRDIGGTKLTRFKEVMGELATKQKELEAFNEVFPPLP